MKNNFARLGSALALGAAVGGGLEGCCSRTYEKGYTEGIREGIELGYTMNLHVGPALVIHDSDGLQYGRLDITFAERKVDQTPDIMLIADLRGMTHDSQSPLTPGLLKELIARRTLPTYTFTYDGALKEWQGSEDLQKLTRHYITLDEAKKRLKIVPREAFKGSPSPLDPFEYIHEQPLKNRTLTGPEIK